MDGRRKSNKHLHSAMQWLLVLLALLSLFDPPGARAGNRFHERNHTGLLFLYGFDEGQRTSSIPTQARDYSNKYLMGNLTTSTTGSILWNSTRQGFRVPSISGSTRAVSQLSSEAVLPLLRSEFSIEFFISTPQNPVSQSLLIAGFGDWPPGAPFAGCDASDTLTDGGWRLYSTLGNVIRFSATIHFNGGPYCSENIAIPVTLNTLTHLVARGRDGVIDMRSMTATSYFNPSGTTFNPSYWARHHAPLTLASPHATNGWTGSIFMISMYDRYLSNTEVEAKRLSGPPNSLAVTLTSSIPITEDTTTTLYP